MPWAGSASYKVPNLDLDALVADLPGRSSPAPFHVGLAGSSAGETSPRPQPRLELRNKYGPPERSAMASFADERYPRAGRRGRGRPQAPRRRARCGVPNVRGRADANPREDGDPRRAVTLHDVLSPARPRPRPAASDMALARRPHALLRLNATLSN